MEQRKVQFRRNVYCIRHYPPYTVLLQVLVVRRRGIRCGDLPARVIARCVLLSSTPPYNHLHLRIDIEKELGVDQPPLHREHPSATLWEAAKRLFQTHARRVPLLDIDTETGQEVIISVLTQYRLLKFISINVSISD